MRQYLGLADPIGRCMVATLFLASGYNHITKWPTSLATVADRGLPAPSLMLAAAALVEIAGSVCLILGWNTRIAALALAAFSIVATSLFHADFGVQTEFHMFGKDIALAGALLCLSFRAPGPFSLDGRSRAT